MKSFGMFAIVGSSVIAVAGAILATLYGGAAERRAIGTSALIAFVVQLIAFAIIRLSAKENVVAGWGVGAILRFLVFVTYALVIVKALALPAGAAMVSMALFLFVSTLVEPLFLKT